MVGRSPARLPAHTMNTRKTPSFSLVALLAVVLIAAPLLPALATTAQMDRGPDAADVHAHEHQGGTAGHPDMAQSDEASSCTQHTTCASQCCAACAHCAAIASLTVNDAAGPLSVKSPVVPLLVLSLLPTGPVRPPQIDRR